MNVADILALLEEHPEIRSAELVARVQDARRRLLSAGLDGSVSGLNPWRSSWVPDQTLIAGLSL